MTLELGGKSAQVVFADADLDALAPVVVNAIIQNGGQTCSAGSRLLVERSAYEAVTEAVAKRFAKLRAGPPERDLDLGPMINANQKRRVESYLDDGRGRSPRHARQGSIAEDAPKGGYLRAPDAHRHGAARP